MAHGIMDSTTFNGLSWVVVFVRGRWSIFHCFRLYLCRMRYHLLLVIVPWRWLLNNIIVPDWVQVLPLIGRMVSLMHRWSMSIFTHLFIVRLNLIQAPCIHILRVRCSWMFSWFYSLIQIKVITMFSFKSCHLGLSSSLVLAFFNLISFYGKRPICYSFAYLALYLSWVDLLALRLLICLFNKTCS